MARKHYHYDPISGALTGMDDSKVSPREPWIYLLPAYATWVEPPPPREGMNVVFIDGRWIYRQVTGTPGVPVNQEGTYLSKVRKFLRI